jgi:anti-sigma regulatory factor (Ser/Thr protein kinase)
VFTQRFSATRRGARLARLLAEHELVSWGIPRGTGPFDAIALVVAEFASNAALHGRVPGRDFELQLTYDREIGIVRIEASDTHPAHPVRVQPAPEDDQGRGLALVEAFTIRWGVRDRLGPGKTVWAEVEAPAGPDAPTAYGSGELRSDPMGRRTTPTWAVP